jgi:hypothetical protein
MRLRAKDIRWRTQLSVAACVVLLVVWIASRWYAVAITTPGGHDVGVGGGVFSYCVSEDLRGVGWQTRTFTLSSSMWCWWFDAGSFGWRVGRWWSVPLWMPLVAMSALTLWLWRRDARHARRVLTGRCEHCRYDLAGLNADAPCPECGRSRGAST